MKKKHFCANKAQFLRRQQGRNKVRWCLRQEAGLAPLCSNLRSFGSKCAVLKKVFVTLLGLYGAHIVIRRPGNCAPLAPLVTPLRSKGAFSLWCKKGKAFCERPLALYRQQHGKDKQNIKFAPLEKFLRSQVLLTWIFSSFWHFSDMFWLFLTCKYNKHKYLNYRNFYKPFLCNIQSLETWNLRDRDETWNLRDRDS